MVAGFVFGSLGRTFSAQESPNKEHRRTVMARAANKVDFMAAKQFDNSVVKIQSFPSMFIQCYTE